VLVDELVVTQCIVEPPELPPSWPEGPYADC
jgi:hypothetical protein